MTYEEFIKIEKEFKKAKNKLPYRYRSLSNPHSLLIPKKILKYLIKYELAKLDIYRNDFDDSLNDENKEKLRFLKAHFYPSDVSSFYTHCKLVMKGFETSVYTNGKIGEIKKQELLEKFKKER